MYKAVLFDLDGTLTDTLEDISVAMNRALRLHDLPEWPVEAYRYLVGNGAKVVITAGPYGLLDTSLRPLQPGDRSSHVKAVQARLLQLGYTYQWPDGVYGQATQQAVAKARKALGLPEKDAVDAAFYRAIGLILFE